jgi:hypothetical protein
MNRYDNTLTLFDADDLRGTLMSATGADDFTARFMAALNEGGIQGDAEFLHPPTDADFMFPELASSQLVRVALTPGSASHREDGTTVLVRFTIGHRAPDLMWQTDVEKHRFEWRREPVTS